MTEILKCGQGVLVEDGICRWISVKDKMPEPGASVIVTAVLGSGQRVVRAATYTTYGFSGNGNFHDVRAWMPMPEPYYEEDYLGTGD